MEELSINKIKLLLLTFLIFTISSCLGTAAEIHVSSGGSIQAAVNSAHSGDTIIVDPGMYIENIYINKTGDLDNLVLTSASGDPINTTITPKPGSNDPGVISITRYKNNVTVRGFTIRGATNGMAGIYLDHGKQCTIENNVFADDYYGVYVNGGTSSDSNVIRKNTFSRAGTIVNDTVGINIADSGNAMVYQNTITKQFNGIRLSGSTSKGSQILENTANNNGHFGIYINNAKGITVKGNTLVSNDLMGINLAGSSENTVTNNYVEMKGTSSSTGDYTQGIQLIYSGSDSSPVGSDSNVVSNNIINNAAHGYFSNNCKNNTIINNRVYGCNYGIAMRFSTKNRIINNNASGNKNGINGEGIFLTYDDKDNIVSGNTANECLGAGIHLNENCGENNTVDNNTVNSNDYYGIHVNTYKSKIINNHASDNLRGIYLAGSKCHDNTVSGNALTENRGYGIYLMNTTAGNRIVSNTLITNNIGINVYNSNNSYIDSNFAQVNDNQGIQVDNSIYVTINNNTADGNGIGIRLSLADNNTVSRNTATRSGQSGIDMNSSLNNTITGNLITSNDDHGLSMCPACRHNLIYDNYFDNGDNANVKNSANTWYITRALGKNVVKGPYIGGNFWAKPDDEGFSQTASDTNGDGIADTPYTVTASDGSVLLTDIFPLVNVVLPVPEFSMSTTQGTAPLSVQFTDQSQNAESRRWNFGDGNTSTELNPTNIYSKVGTYTVNLTVSNKNDSSSKLATVTVQAYVAPPVYPVADFTADQTSGYAPLTVKFTDASQNSAAWNWNFGDGGTSTEQSPTYIYNSEGTFTVNLVASNANGTSSKVSTITVSSTSSGGSSSGSSSSSSGGSGGGGGGGSPEPQNNVEIKELSQTSIFASQPVKFEFPQKVTAVESITFNSKKSVGKTTTIVEMLKNQSTLVSGKPSDEVYKYLNIWVGNGGYATPKNIENAVVTFKVAKSWVQDNKIDKSSITLNRYDNKTWNPLTTTLSSEDDSTYLKFTAQAPGFSPFAITGKSTAIQPAAGDKTQPATVSQTQSNTGNGSTANTNKTAEQKESPSPTQKQSTSLPGFEAVIGVAGLVAVFLYRRK